MTEQRPEKPETPARGSSTEEKVGQTLGKAFGRLKKTKVWKDTEKAYREGLEGKK